MSPKRLPTVSTGKPMIIAPAVPITRATTVPGTRGTRRTNSTMMASETMPRPAATGEAVSQCAASTCIRPTNSPGTSAIRSPKKSLIWVLAIRTAMPLVKPTTTGRGMNLTVDPRPVSPMMTSRTPAIIVHMNRPSMPNSATMPATTTTKAPVGPPIWHREPPRAEIRKPVTMAQ